MATLAAAVGVDDTTITVTEGDTPPGRGGVFPIDDELLEYVGPARVNLGVGDNHLNRNVWRVRRGKSQTAAATHDEGTEFTAYVALFGETPLSAPGGASDAASVSYDNAESGLTAEDVQAALDEVAAAPGGEGVEVNGDAVTNIVAPGATVEGGEATLGKWALTKVSSVGVDVSDADLSVTATANDDGGAGIGPGAVVSRSAVGTGISDAYADTTATAEDGDAHANTAVTVTGIQDANATTVASSAGGNADVSRSASVTDLGGGDANASTVADSADGQAEARANASAGTTGEATVKIEANSQDGIANADAFAAALGDGDAHATNFAEADGAGLATASLEAVGNGGTAYIRVVADATSARIGFFAATPIARPELPATPDEQDIADVLVALGLVTQAAP